ncbi:MAG: MgtC/SapB family protein [bacterium]|nr:MgtC/SapB family protein [bacterium]
MDILIVTFQLSLSAILGAVIGWERERIHKAAGHRTLGLVAVGVTLFTLISQYGFPGAVDFDPSRIAAQVISGIGFLGAGLIIFHNDKIENLTTAATIWIVASIAMAVGIGWYSVALIATVLALVILHIMRLLIPGKK